MVHGSDVQAYADFLPIVGLEIRVENVLVATDRCSLMRKRMILCLQDIPCLCFSPSFSRAESSARVELPDTSFEDVLGELKKPEKTCKNAAETQVVAESSEQEKPLQGDYLAMEVVVIIQSD